MVARRGRSAHAKEREEASEQDAVVHFLGHASAGTYTFTVREHYADGPVKQWAIAALVVGALGLVTGAAALVVAGRR